MCGIPAVFPQCLSSLPNMSSSPARTRRCSTKGLFSGRGNRKRRRVQAGQTKFGLGQTDNLASEAPVLELWCRQQLDQEHEAAVTTQDCSRKAEKVGLC